MFNQTALESYQQISATRQREYGRQLIQDELNPQPGDAILDLGCGTGELAAHLAELVGQQGKVLGVDPDIERIKVAQESHKGVQNLSFVEGSSSNFPNMGSESYNIVFSNLVLHWVSDKDEAFRNMFSSLKPEGKIVLTYVDYLPASFHRFYGDLNPENYDRILNKHKLQTRQVIDEMSIAAGFNILKSFEVTVRDFAFKDANSLCSFFWAITHGMFNPQLVTEDRLASFCARYSSGKAGEISLGDFNYCVLIAVKPAKSTE